MGATHSGRIQKGALGVLLGIAEIKSGAWEQSEIPMDSWGGRVPTWPPNWFRARNLSINYCGRCGGGVHARRQTPI